MKSYCMFELVNKLYLYIYNSKLSKSNVGMFLGEFYQVSYRRKLNNNYIFIFVIGSIIKEVYDNIETRRT